MKRAGIRKMTNIKNHTEDYHTGRLLIQNYYLPIAQNITNYNYRTSLEPSVETFLKFE